MMRLHLECNRNCGPKRYLPKFSVLMNLSAVLVTYCAKGSVKRALKAVGFEVESLEGPPGKREMTRAKKTK